MTKILQIMAGAKVGGAEEFYMRLIPALSAAGVDQRAILRHHPAREAILTAAGIPFATARLGGPFDLSTRRVIRHEVGQYTPDLVLAWMSRAAKYAPSGKHVLAARLGGYYDLKYYRNCDHLIGNTEAIRSYLVDQGWPADRAWYIPNFVDGNPAEPVERETLTTPDDAPLLLALGRLHTNKAYDVLIESLAQTTSAYLWIAGEGPLEQSLRAQAEKLGVTDRIRFLGWRTDIPALLAAADVLVCPSRHEPLGNVVIEGWAHNVPVVAANSDGPRSLIEDGVTGLLTPIDDADSFAQAINRVLLTPAFAAALASAGAAAYQTAFTEEIVVQQYQAFFEKVL